MAHDKHLELLRQGELAWNQWRRENPGVTPDLRRAELQGSQLAHCDLSGADLQEARFAWADLRSASFRSADLRGVKINDARAPYADFTDSQLQKSYLWGSDFREAVFCCADLSGANLMCAQLIRADFTGANLTGCKVYGTSAWEVKVDGRTKQEALVITPPDRPDEAAVTVDDLQVAQFVFLLLNHEALRLVMRSVTERGVLLLGRFGGGGIEMLRALADQLRERGYLPMIFDFPRDPNRNYTETIKTLVGLSRFVVVDLSGPSVPQELYSTVPHFKIPFVPILERGRHHWSMFKDILEYDWVLKPIVQFENQEALQRMLDDTIVKPAEACVARRQRLLQEIFGEARETSAT
jgi:hypothetical protein